MKMETLGTLLIKQLELNAVYVTKRVCPSHLGSTAVRVGVLVSDADVIHH